MEQVNKSDTDVRREMQRAALMHDLSQAKTLKEYAWMAIQNGSDPAYVAMRYGFPLEQMVAAKAEHQRREELKREREVTARGDCSASESR